MSVKKKVACILLIVAACFAYCRVLRPYDYFRNSTLKVTEEDGYTGAYYLNKGEYTLELSYSSEKDFGVKVIALDNQNVLGEKIMPRGEHTEYIDFSVDQKLRAVDLLIDSSDDLVINEVYYESNGPVYTDRYFIVGFLAVCSSCFVYLYKRKKYDLLIVIGIALFVSFPFFGKDLKEGHDLYFHLERIYNIGLQFSRGNYFSRVNDANIYAMGSITPAIYPELFLYLPGLMVGLGASLVLSFKVLCVFINVGTALICYYAVSRIANKRIAMIAVFIYLLNPYRMNDIFVRSAVGESIAMMFMPLALYGVYELVQGDYQRGSFGAVVGISGVVQSHLLSAAVFVVTGVGYGVVYVITHWKKFWTDRKRLIWLIGSAIFTVALNIGFIVPFLRYDSPDYNIKNTLYSLENTSASLYRIFIDTYSNRSVYNGMSISLGTGMLLGIIVIFVVLLARRNFKYKGLCTGCLVISFIAIWLSSELFPWNSIQYSFGLYSLFGLLQFPWRLLIVASPLLSLTIAIVLEYLIAENKKVIPLVVVIFCLISGLRSMEGYFTQNGALMDSKSDYYPLVYNADYYRDNNTGQAVSNIRNRIIVSSDSTAEFDYDYDKRHVISYEGLSGSATVDLPVYYYENLYLVKVNGAVSEYECSDAETVRVVLDGKSSHGKITVEVNQKQFILTDGISIALFVLLIVIRTKRKDYREVNWEDKDEGYRGFNTLL